jgi:hypothetical protein
MPIDSTPILKGYASWRAQVLSQQDPGLTQKRVLTGLLRRGKRTRFGQDHCLDEITSIADFQARVPLRTYEDYWKEYWSGPFPTLTGVTWPGTVPYFAETSGTTTGRSKYIPVSDEMLIANSWAAADLLVHHIANRPDSRILGGLSFLLGGSTGLRELAPGISSGDLSGIEARVFPWWLRPWHFPPAELELMVDWEAKIDALANAVIGQDVRAISGVPSWLLVLFDRLEELRPDLGHRLVNFFPNLELLVHGGVDFGPYRRNLLNRLEGSHAETRETFAASEGFVAVADRGDGEGLRLILDNGLFFEFVPVEELDQPNPSRHWMRNAEVGVNYAVVLTTCAGLWAYILGDTAEFVTLSPPRIRITGRSGLMLSAFGEHLIGVEIESAVSSAASSVGLNVVDYTVGATVAERKGEQGQHLFIVEFAEGPPDAAVQDHFLRELDHRLAEVNADYRSHRIETHGLRPPRLIAVAPGTFYGWMRHREKLGGQHKVPRIINDEVLLADLRRFVAAAS